MKNRMKNTSPLTLLIGIAASSLLMSCSKNDPVPQPVVSTKVTDLAADPPTGYDGMTGQPIGTTGQFTFFSFKTGEVVAHADSATTQWDLGFRGTTIIINGGTSGPGNAGAQVLSGIFDEIAKASESGYKQDNGNELAIPTGSDNGWYHYDGAAFVITPIAGKVIMVRTADGHYAKVEILSYYKGAPAQPDAFMDLDRYYTFRYSYQPNDNTLTF
jgi:HmuY protein